MEQQNFSSKKDLQVLSKTFFKAYKSLTFKQRKQFREMYFPIAFEESVYPTGKQPDRWKNQQAGTIAMNLSDLRIVQGVWDKLKLPSNPLNLEQKYVIL